MSQKKHDKNWTRLGEAKRNIKSSNPANGRIPKDIQRLQPCNDVTCNHRAPGRRWPAKLPMLRTPLKKPDSKKGQGNETEDKNWTNLEKAKGNIKLSKPAKDDIPKDIQRLQPCNDARKIEYFPEVNDDAVRENFKKFRKDTFLQLDLENVNQNLTGRGPGVGTNWHSILKKYIDDPAKNESKLEAKAVVDALKSEFEGIEFLKTRFLLYGYMIDKESSQVSFWNGFANAIGWYENRYVIVEWTAVKNLNIWEGYPHAHGEYLHKCLVYARLLQLHLQLHELPYILIVAISNQTGKVIRPALFRDFPEECKDALEKFTWSKDQPELGGRLKRTVVVDKYKRENEIKMETPVRDVLAENTTVGDLLDALHLKFSKLKLVGL